MPVVELPVETSMIENSVRVTRGSSKTLTYTFGTDLSDTSVYFRVRRRPTAPDILLDKPTSIIHPASDGKISVTIDAADLTSIQSGSYIYTIYGVTTAGVVFTLASGQFFVEPFDEAFVGRIEPILRLALTTTIERITLETRDQEGILSNPESLRVTFFDHADQPVLALNLGDSTLYNPQGGIFYFDFQSNRAGDYLAVWQYQFPGEEPQTVVKNIRWVTPAMFRIMPEVRLYIDKARKASNRTIAYNPVDIAEYIENSLRDFNATPPSTNIALEALEGVLSTYKEIIILGAIIQACIAQGLLAVDQDFAYNDNGISLAIDHHSKLQSWYRELLTQYTQRKMLYKKNFFSPTAHVRTVIGQAFSLGLAKVPASTLSRFRGWI